MKPNKPFSAACMGVLLLLAVAGSVFAQNPDLPYSSGSTGADGALSFIPSPAGRYDHAVAFDSTRNKLVFFGGTTTGSRNAETWEWDGVSWTQRNPANSPSARAEFAMAYDSARQKTVLFGGYTSSANNNETWEWDGTNWTQKNPTASPAARYAHAMAYDSNRQKMVVFGGYYSYTDTWEYDGTTWTQKTSATVPAGRYNHCMAYDSNRQRVVMYGGDGGNATTWEWDGTLWVQKISAANPVAYSQCALAYDSVRQKTILFGGYNNNADTWEWDGTNWTKKSPTTSPTGRAYHAMAYDSNRQRTVMFGGQTTLSSYEDDTWEYDGTKWTQRAGSNFFFDMTTKPSGTWNFTTISVPSNVYLRFLKNTGNTAVTWLASGNVQIDGQISLDGTASSGNNSPGNQGKGGPGGFDGGLGGTRFSASSSYAGTPGQGPGGGAPGTTSGSYGANATSTYGNAYLQPLVGGSGGGGGASNDNSDGGNGGGGGGAMLIASSKDITVTGSIHADGGGQTYGGASYGGTGSRGAIRLVADRVSGAGTVRADRTRIEGYFRTLLQNGSITGSVSNTTSTPIATSAGGSQPTLAVTSVAGQPVAQPPSGSPASPDVIFSSAGTITIVITATNIPDGTPVTCRVTSGAQVINLPASGYPSVNLATGTATFTTTVQPGVGSVQAFCNFTTGP